MVWQRDAGRAVRRRRRRRPAIAWPLRDRGPTACRCATAAPTTWQAVIETPNKAASFREFVFAVQDTTLTYSPFASTVVNPFAAKAGARWGTAPVPRPTATSPASNCATGVCYAYGFCSNSTQVRCKPADLAERRGHHELPQDPRGQAHSA